MPDRTEQGQKHARILMGPEHAKPMGYRDISCQPILSNPTLEVPEMAERLKKENADNNKSAGSSILVIVLGGLLLYAIFFRG